ncbi:MAG: hypothetical protein KA715_04950 [Xanthomonadaceae bacterium]|nr:hypothetical protein [Xanthomonadaceae bacterium]
MKNILSTLVLVVFLFVLGCGPGDERRVPVSLKFSGFDNAVLTDGNTCKLRSDIHDGSEIGVLYLVAHYPDATQDYFLLNDVYFDQINFDGSFRPSVIDFSRVQRSFDVKPRLGVRFSINGVIYRHKNWNGSGDSGGSNGWNFAQVTPGHSYLACSRAAANSSVLGYTDASSFPIVVVGLSDPVDVTQKNQSVTISNIEFFRTHIDSVAGNALNLDDNAICGGKYCGDVVRGFDGKVEYNGSNDWAVSTRTPRALAANTNFAKVRVRVNTASLVKPAPIQFAFVDETAPGAPAYSNQGWLPFPCGFKDKGTLPIDGAGNQLFNDGAICRGHHFYAGNIFKSAGDSKVFEIWPLFPNRKYRLVVATYIDQASTGTLANRPAVYDEVVLNDSTIFNTGFSKKSCIACSLDVNTGSATNGVGRFGVVFSPNNPCTTVSNTFPAPTGSQCRAPTASDYQTVNCYVEACP